MTLSMEWGVTTPGPGGEHAEVRGLSAESLTFQPGLNVIRTLRYDFNLRPADGDLAPRLHFSKPSPSVHHRHSIQMH